ncbi:hypothetical protein ACQWTT_001288 [Acinetobacter baumannii]
MKIDTAISPFISTDDSGEVFGIFSFGWHSEEELREKSIEKYGLKHWVVDDLLNNGGYFKQDYFILNSDNYLIPVKVNHHGKYPNKSFPVSMWKRLI